MGNRNRDRDESNNGRKMNRYSEDDLSFMRDKRARGKSAKRTKRRDRVNAKMAFLDS